MLCSFLGFCTRTGGRFEWQQKRPLLVIPFVGGCLPQAEYDNGEIEIICEFVLDTLIPSITNRFF